MKKILWDPLIPTNGKLSNISDYIHLYTDIVTNDKNCSSSGKTQNLKQENHPLKNTQKLKQP